MKILESISLLDQVKSKRPVTDEMLMAVIAISSDVTSLRKDIKNLTDVVDKLTLRNHTETSLNNTWEDENDLDLEDSDLFYDNETMDDDDYKYVKIDNIVVSTDFSTIVESGVITTVQPIEEFEIDRTSYNFTILYDVKENQYSVKVDEEVEKSWFGYDFTDIDFSAHRIKGSANQEVVKIVLFNNQIKDDIGLTFEYLVHVGDKRYIVLTNYVNGFTLV